MKKLIALLLTIVMVLSLCACGAGEQTPTTEPAKGSVGGETGAEEGLMAFTVTVVHADGSSKEFSYSTDAKMLGDYLEEQGLIVSEGADDGMFHTVDGEKADWNESKSYWALYLGEEYAMAGIYDTPIADGAAYKLEYTRG